MLSIRPGIARGADTQFSLDESVDDLRVVGHVQGKKEALGLGSLEEAPSVVRVVRANFLGEATLF